MKCNKIPVLGCVVKAIDRISYFAMRFSIIPIISLDNSGREFVPIPVFSINTTVIVLWLPLFLANSSYFLFEFPGVINVFASIIPAVRRLSEADCNGDALLFCALWASLLPSVIFSFRISSRAPKIIMIMIENGVDPINIAVSMILGMCGFAACMYTIFFSGDLVDMLFGRAGGVLRTVGISFMYSTSTLWVDSGLAIYFMVIFLFKRRGKTG